MTGAVKKTIDDLRKQLEHHNYLYYVAATPEISDRDYDRLMAELQALEAEHPEFDSASSPSRKVGGEPIDGFQQFEHRVPMLSIDNAFQEQELVDWDAGLQKTFGTSDLDYSVEYKIDGVAIALIWENGTLVRAEGHVRGTERAGPRRCGRLRRTARALRVILPGAATW